MHRIPAVSKRPVPVGADSVHAPSARHPRLTLATCILASSLAFVDGSVVNVALPAIGSSLQVRGAALQWVINAYLLPLSALLLFGGAAGDRYGRRRLLVLGTGLFAAASLACALTTTLPLLLAGRFVQGASAALLMPNSLALLGHAFVGSAKGRAIGIWASTGAAMGALGPVLGGWLVDRVGWRAIFLINLPLAIGAVALALRFVEPDPDGHDRPLDGWGALGATLGLGLATWGLTVGSSHGWNAASIGALALAFAVLAAFVLVERELGERAMMPLGLFVSRTFVGLSLLTVFLYGALGALFVLLPFVLIEEAHYSATAAGAALMPLPVVLAISSPTMGALAGKIGPRVPLTVGPWVVAAGFGLMLRVGTGAPYLTEVLPALLVIALGLSGAVAPLTTAVLSTADARHLGSASGFNSAVARAGGLIATALVGPVLAGPRPAARREFSRRLDGRGRHVRPGRVARLRVRGAPPARRPRSAHAMRIIWILVLAGFSRAASRPVPVDAPPKAPATVAVPSARVDAMAPPALANVGAECEHARFQPNTCTIH